MRTPRRKTSQGIYFEHITSTFFVIREILGQSLEQHPFFPHPMPLQSYGMFPYEKPFFMQAMTSWGSFFCFHLQLRTKSYINSQLFYRMLHIRKETIMGCAIIFAGRPLLLHKPSEILVIEIKLEYFCHNHQGNRNE